MRRRMEFRKKLNELFKEFSDLPSGDIASELAYYHLYYALNTHEN